MNRSTVIRAAFILSLSVPSSTFLRGQTAAAPAAPRVMGAIASLDAANKRLTVKTDAGDTYSVKLSDATRMQKVAPGEKDLKTATLLAFEEMAEGDRAIIMGAVSVENKSIDATRLIVMTKGDLAKKQEREKQDWAVRGSSGVVVATKPEGTEVTIQTKSMIGASKDVVVAVSEKTAVRRYAPDSIMFQDAKPARMSEIAKGDQIRVRGDKTPDGDKIVAEDIVFGTFQLAGGQITEVSADAVKIKDLQSKKIVTVKVTAESQLHKMPEQMARMMAMRLNGGAEGGGGGAPGGGAPGGGARPAGGGAPGGFGGGGAGGGGGRGGDMMERMPKFQLSELKVGEAILVLSSKGATADLVTAISMLSGVEPILTAPARGRDPMGGMMSGMMGDTAGMGGAGVP
jgi:hypothetical protein